MTTLFTTADNRTQLKVLWEANTELAVIELDDLDMSLQTRVDGSDDDTCERYATVMEQGGTFPPIDVFIVEEDDEETAYLVNGFHRTAAYRLRFETEVEARIFRGRTREEAKLYGHFANLDNGREASKDDLREAVVALLKMDATQTQFFKSKYELDTKKISEWTSCTIRHVQILTERIRKHLLDVRDKEILIRKKSGESERVIVKETGASKGTVSRTTRPKNEQFVNGAPEDQTQSPSSNPNSPDSETISSPTNSTPIPPSVFDSPNFETEDEKEARELEALKKENEAITAMILAEDDEKEEAKKEERRKEQLQRLEKYNKQGYDTLLRNMEKNRKSGKSKPVEDHVDTAFKAINVLATTFRKTKAQNPDLSELAFRIRSTADDEHYLLALMEVAEFITELKAKTLS